MRIEFTILIELENNGFQQEFSNANNAIDDIANVISANGGLDLAVDGNGTLEARDISHGYLELECPTNTIPSYPTLSCGKH